MDNLKQRICDYIRDYMNAGIEVKPGHFLTADLGIDGDQGVYFIEDFSKEFGTDFSAMAITTHFSCRWLPGKLLDGIHELFAGKYPFRNKLVDLRVSDLIAAVERGKWSDSILQRAPTTGKSALI